MALLGTWTALIPNKIVETRRLDGATRRLIALAAGLLVGIVGTVLAQNRRLGLTVQHEFVFPDPLPIEPVYFGACTRSRRAGCPSRPATASRGSASCRSSGRRSCRPWLTPFSGLTTATGRQIAIAAILIATAVQLVSPWNRGGRALRAVSSGPRKSKAQRQSSQVLVDSWYLTGRPSKRIESNSSHWPLATATDWIQ